MQKQVNVTSALAIVAGRHTLKMGLDYRRTDTGVTRPSIGTSAFYFSADQIQRNMPTSFGLSRGGGDARQLYLNHSAYIQDE